MDGSEGEGDLVLMQTFFALLWKLFLKNTRQFDLHDKAGRFVSKQAPSASLPSITVKWPIRNSIPKMSPFFFSLKNLFHEFRKSLCKPFMVSGAVTAKLFTNSFCDGCCVFRSA